MATGPLRFRTPHIEELPNGLTKHAPGFAYVAVTGQQEDPAKNWGTTNRKRQRTTTSGQTEQGKEEISAKQQRDIERKIRDLNREGSRDVQIPLSKKEGLGGGISRIGKTANTKKILASGKTFIHYLDDEEAEIARTGRRDGDVEAPVAAQRPSKTPYARRRPREGGSASGSPAPPAMHLASTATESEALPTDPIDLDPADLEGDITPLPSRAEMEALLNAAPLTYTQARSAPPPPSAPPPRSFCETCGYWGRVKCKRCGAMTCSVTCKDSHDEFRCLKFPA